MYLGASGGNEILVNREHLKACLGTSGSIQGVVSQSIYGYLGGKRRGIYFVCTVNVYGILWGYSSGF